MPTAEVGVQAWLTGLESTLNWTISRCTPVTGGDICESFRLELADDRQIFLKRLKGDGEALVAEARGLDWLAATASIAVPEVLAVGIHDGFGYLALAWLDFVPASSLQGGGLGAEQTLGRQLAALHGHGAGTWGFPHVGFIGTIDAGKSNLLNLGGIYHQRRLAPLVERCHAQGLLDVRDCQTFARLFNHLEQRVGPDEPPARLHGDLWAGNQAFDNAGRAFLFDPAAYAGHREVDLAMMRLFGGFTERTFAAYEEIAPLAPGHHERVSLYQIYPLLVHLILFGASYHDRLMQAVHEQL